MRFKIIKLTICVYALLSFLGHITVASEWKHKKPNSTEISFTFQESLNDTISIIIYEFGEPYEYKSKDIQMPIHGKTTVSFKIDFLSMPGRFMVQIGNKIKRGPRYYISPGEELKFDIKKLGGIYKITSADSYYARQYLCLQKLYRLSKGFDVLFRDDYSLLGPPLPNEPFEVIKYAVNNGKRIFDAQWIELNKNRTAFSSSTLERIKADLIGEYLADACHTVYAKFKDKRKSIASTEAYSALVNEILAEKNIYGIKIYSNRFVFGCLRMLRLKEDVAGLNVADMSVMLQAIEKNYSGELRDLLYAHYLLEATIKNPTKFTYHARETISKITNSKIKKVLREDLAKKEVGVDFFPFELTKTDGKKITLADLKGKTVLIDVWFTGCSGCVGAAQMMEEKIIPRYKNNKDVIFVSLSTDKDKAKWLKSVEGGIYTAPESLNLYTNGEGMEHPLMEYYNINGAPHFMLINGEGKTISPKIAQAADKIIEMIDKALQAKSGTHPDKESDNLVMIFQSDNNLELEKMLGKDDVNKCYGEYSLLSHAIRYDAKKCFDFLISKNANVNLVCNGYLPPLMHAAKYGRLEMAKILIGKGASLNYKYEGNYEPAAGETPYTYAVKYGKTEVAELLKSQAKN